MNRTRAGRHHIPRLILGFALGSGGACGNDEPIVSPPAEAAPHSGGSSASSVGGEAGAPTSFVAGAGGDSPGGESAVSGGGFGGVDANGGASGASTCSPELGSSFNEHACLHAEQGPFATLVAAPETPAATISQTHTAYSVSMPAGTEIGFVALRVAQTGAHALFVHEDIPLEIRPTDDPAVALTPNHEQSVDACAELTHVAVYELAAGVQYEVLLGPGAAVYTVVVEHITSDEVWDCGSPGEDPAEPEDPDPAEPEDPDPSDPLGAGGCAQMEDECVQDCSVLGAACTQGQECCSGRCYSRQCVPAECRPDGFCVSNDECCLFCHQTESPHCH